MKRYLAFLLVIALGSLVGQGCGGNETGTDGGADGNNPDNLLDSSHASYGANPHCWECHTEDDHNKDLAPYQCAECHGNNGASEGHERPTTPCSNCHTPAPHGEDGFPDPDSCMVCHKS